MLKFHCERCGRETDLLTVKEASALVQVSRRTVENWMADGRVHVFQTAGGRPQICRRTLIVPWPSLRSPRLGAGRASTVLDRSPFRTHLQPPR
jgi:excisionase family DNA binding protein